MTKPSPLSDFEIGILRKMIARYAFESLERSMIEKFEKEDISDDDRIK